MPVANSSPWVTDGDEDTVWEHASAMSNQSATPVDWAIAGINSAGISVDHPPKGGAEIPVVCLFYNLHTHKGGAILVGMIAGHQRYC